MNIKTHSPSPTTASRPHSARLILAEDERLIRSFELALSVENLTKASVESYVWGVEKAVLYVREDMGLAIPLNELTAEHLREVMAWQLKTYKPATAYSVHASLKRFHGWMLEDGERRDDPMVRVPRPKVPEQRTEIVSRDSIKALLAACARDKSTMGQRDAAVILLLLDTGLRVGELTGLNIGDVDVRVRELTVMGKGRRPRTVAFSARSAQAIDRYLRRARKDGQDADPLFTGRYRTRLDRGGVGDMLHRRAQEAGLKERIWPHRLRHTAATLLADSGVQEGELRAILGWSASSSMVYHYTQSTLAKRARDAQRRASVLDRLLD